MKMRFAPRGALALGRGVRRGLMGGGSVRDWSKTPEDQILPSTFAMSPSLQSPRTALSHGVHAEDGRPSQSLRP